ncbi:2-isopropylmalate synthase [Clostridium luticellarii]|uniref:2-isopropylmalate synthase n=1 Tax=Clostridium luticellarii TaxID=1691940 RepID=A0A2T0BKL8_9CLOT|nr:2-isopropylmalate synthase [Clostridium luticellarii]MCI1946078.1 2-isopropylmalate synthase [Clostridium luticellarii]MCI1967516.1 2-isopropylmalate synthase [Clostridium luticellarii]MCI1996441.1 2-isopropylmalate synthase [Clostridium luticellarii]MCI2040794.1 2-isopropylmalate synthase [Clostridium luticellarii]PRR84440.1 2-isopropylmalate synthase [Clostridium luticellarii]
MKNCSARYKLDNVANPNLYKDIFPYDEIPKIIFDRVQVPMDIPEEIYITDTTFRDGQQSRPPYTSKQIIRIFDYLHQLDNDSGIIKQTEFFLYTEKDRTAAEKCMEKGYEFPEVTSWIRANKEDFKLVKQMGIRETGMLMSCSDYHIFKKLKMTRQEAVDLYLSVVKEALNNGIHPRCHLEDITRADFYGFVVPFVTKLMELSREANVPIKIRACDTLGLGVSYSGVAVPRSVQKIIHGLRTICGVPSDLIEWHGHNDFYSVVDNSTTAWLYGASSINTSILGIGERTGNCPLEAMVFEYAQLKGNTKNMNLHVITELAEYFSREMKYDVPTRTPFVGKEFNETRAGIHADGILKDEEIYNAFNTDKILGKPIVVAVNQYSGHAGIAAWINTYYRLEGNNKIDKKDKRVNEIKLWVDEQYKLGRTTMIGNNELEMLVKKVMPEIMRKKEERAS